MSRINWRPANLLNPLPLVIVTCTDENGRNNAMTAAWTGTICSDPVMVSVSIRKSRFSYDIIKNSKECVLNMVPTNLVLYADYVGTYSGKKIDKFNLKGDLHVTPIEGKIVKAPIIKECPIALECKVKEIKELGIHDMFILEVVSSSIDDEYIDKSGRLDFKKAGLVTYCHGEYYELGKKIGSFGYSSKKPERLKRHKLNHK